MRVFIIVAVERMDGIHGDLAGKCQHCIVAVVRSMTDILSTPILSIADEAVDG
jgi:hypothetical protein